MFVEVVLKGIPSTSNANHHVIAKNLRRKTNQKCVVNFRTVYFLCFVNIICTIIDKKLGFGQFSKWFIQCSWFWKDECSYDEHKFNYSSQKKFLISPNAFLLFCFEMRILFWLLYLICVTLGPSKLENVADPCSGPRGPLPKIGVHYLNLNGAV